MGKKLGDFVHSKALFYIYIYKKGNGQRFFYILYKHEREVDIVISIFLPLDTSFYVKKLLLV